jgi:microcompartment protein CcmL/EutN
MPIRRCEETGKPGFKWGEQGKCYVYTSGDAASIRAAKEKCLQQAVAMGEMSNEQMRQQMAQRPR